MHYRNMGKSGLRVSAITLGALWFGSRVDETMAIRIVDRALDAGINCVDTADIYGKDRWDTPQRGPSEEIVGKALKGRRGSVVLATKVAALTGPGANDRGLSRKHIVEGFHESLRRLKTDYIDIYYLHEPDYATPLEESLETLNDLVRQGKVLYVGLSNYYAWQVCKALWITDKRGWAGIDCIQMVHNLIARDAELEMTKLCEAEGIGINVWGALAGGMLSGKFLEHDPSVPPPPGVKPYPSVWTPSYFQAVARFKELAGPRSMSLDLGLGDDDLGVCDDIWRALRPSPTMFYARGYGIDFK